MAEGARFELAIPLRVCRLSPDNYFLLSGGGGIRTHEPDKGLHAFQACAIDRYATPPLLKRKLNCRGSSIL